MNLKQNFKRGFITGFICLFALHITYAQGNMITIRGRVIDENADPMIGVSVLVKGTQNGTITDLDGNYVLKAAANRTLIFSYVGYEVVEKAIKGEKNVSLQLQPSSLNLTEVVAVGYGTQRKVDITGSVASVNAEDLTRLPVSNVFEALSGKIAGLQVVNDSEPGAAPTVRVRGVGSYGNADPICVIDGQFFEISELTALNPNDVESLTVLKDASATAIYGSRGANGVIIVETKQGSGENGKVRVNAGAYFSLSQMERTLDLANTSEWQQIENLKYLADQWDNPNAYQTIPYPSWQTAGEGNDWQELISQQAFTQNYNTSIAGSSPKMDYYVSAAFLDQEGVIQHSNYTRFTGKINLTFKPYKWLKMGINSTMTFDNQITVEGDVLGHAGKRKASDPLYGGGEDIEDGFSGGDNNPMALLHYTHDRYNKSWRYINNAYAEISFLKNLKLRSSIAMTNNSREMKKFLPAFMEDSGANHSNYLLSRFYHNTSLGQNWLQENTLTYTLHKRKHRLNLMGGATFQVIQSQNANLFATELPWSAWKNRNLWYVGQGQNTTGIDSGSEKSYMSFLARIGYTYADRYSVTLTGRADGSSAYSAANQFGYFPAIGASWYISEEHFMKSARWIDQLKLRASYGVVGNDRGVSAAQMLYADQKDWVTGPSGEIEKVDALRLMIDNTLTWESTATANIGLDFSMMKNLFGITVEAYDKTTTNVMMPLNVPPSNLKVTSNIGTIRNRGVEMSVKYNPKIGAVKTFFQLTGTLMDNKVMEINDHIGPIADLPNQTIEGYPIGGFWGYQTLGVFQNEDQLTQMPKVNGTEVGDLIFADKNQDGYIDELDYVYMGSYLPSAMLNFTGRAQYKGFTFSLELNSSLGHKSYVRRNQQRMTGQNYTTDMLNAWSGEGSTNIHPRVFERGNGSAMISDYFVENCDYLSISNMQLAYNFPLKWIKTLKMSNLRIYISGANLYTFTEASGYKYDIIMRGNNANQGGVDDFGLYPKNRTYTAGLSFTF